MSVHIGEIIKKIVKSKGVSVTDFADRINYSRRNVYEIFDKTNIDKGLLIKISKELGQNLFLFYISDKDITEHQGYCRYVFTSQFFTFSKVINAKLIKIRICFS